MYTFEKRLGNEVAILHLENLCSYCFYTCSVTASPPGGCSESDKESLGKADQQTDRSYSQVAFLLPRVHKWFKILQYSVIRTIYTYS